MRYNSGIYKEDPQLREILELIQETMAKAHRPAHEIILDDVDLRNLLKVSDRTTAALRAKRMITYSKPGKVFYLLSDVLKMLDHYKIEAILDQSDYEGK